MKIYRLKGIPIYPKEFPRQNTVSEPEYSDKWYIMPGRKLIHIDKLRIIARKLHAELELVEY